MGDKIGEVRAKTETSADLYFYGDIVSSWWGAWKDEDQYPANIKKFLDEVKGVQNLNIYVNCPGGSVYAGMAIYNMLKRHPANKTVYVDGLAASMGSIIALCGDRVVIPANAYFMIHKPSWGAWGNTDELSAVLDALRTLEEGVLNVYYEHKRPNVSEETICSLVQKETWLTGEEAAQYFKVETSARVDAVASVSSEYYGKYLNMPQGLLKSVEHEESRQLAESSAKETTSASALTRARAGLFLNLTKRRDV